MTFDNTDIALLTVLIATVIPEWFFHMKKSYIKWYDEKRSGPLAVLDFIWRPPRYVFPYAWMFIKLCDVASYYLFFKFTINNLNWTYVAAFAVMLVVQGGSKFWGPLFFDMMRLDLSFFLTIGILLAHAVYFAFIVVAQTVYSNLGYLWYVPMILAIPRLLWLAYATVLGGMWWSYLSPPAHKKKHHHHHGRRNSDAADYSAF